MKGSKKALPAGLRDLTDTSGDDFAAMLEEFGGTSAKKLEPGDKVEAEVIHLSKDAVFCKVSPTQEGVLPLTEVTDETGEPTVAVGDRIEAFVTSTRGGIELRRKLGRDVIDVELLEQAKAERMPIEGTVTGVNKGGLEVAVGGTRGFCPIGQADVDYVEDASVLVGKTLEFLVSDVREEGRNVVLSRRALLEARRREQAEKTLSTLEVGARVSGTVSRVLDFGAFVDIGGVDGLIPISQLSYSNVEAVADIVSPGDHVEVEVLKIEDDPKRPGRPRIGLSLKAAQQDPFDLHADALGVGSEHEGEVTRVEGYGAFVEIFPGLQGLVHVSELGYERVRHPSDVVRVGDAVRVRILKVDPGERRISLSIKDAQPEPLAADGSPLAPGAMVQGIVERIERYGVFVSLAGGPSALLPASETGTDRGTDLARAFPIGTELRLTIIEVDDRGRFKVSKKARDEAEEKATLDAYNRGQKGDGRGFGTLGDLLAAKTRK